MNFKRVLFFGIFCAFLFNLTICSQPYEHITECESTTEDCDNCRTVNLTCTEYGNSEEHIFNRYNEGFQCSSGNYYKSKVGIINFKNCHLHQIERNYFSIFESLHTFNISSVELESLQPKTFERARTLTHLDASQNRISNIPPLLFVNAKKLAFVDFSNNSINRVESLAFYGANDLESLNLSRNNLSGIDEHAFKDLSKLKVLNFSCNKFNQITFRALFPSSLLVLDLSQNNLTSFDEQTLNETTNLKTLNLSFNPIGNFKINTFTFVPNLEHLNLMQTNISNIPLGMFSHQHKLISLELSGNTLKIFDFVQFFPISHDLESIRLDGNNLTELKSFRNNMFPKLVLFDINKNQFNCSYLQQFMESVNWEKIRFQVDSGSVNSNYTNIRGIKCQVSTESKSIENRIEHEIEDQNRNLKELFNEILSKSTERSSGDTFLKFSSALTSIVLLAFFITFLALHRQRIFHQCIAPYNYGRSTAQNTQNTVESLLL